MSNVPKLKVEISIQLEKNSAKPEEKMPAAEEEEVEQDDTQVF